MAVAVLLKVLLQRKRTERGAGSRWAFVDHPCGEGGEGVVASVDPRARERASGIRERASEPRIRAMVLLNVL